MTIRDIAVAFGFEVDKNSEKQAENSINGLKNFASKALSVIKIGFSIAGISTLAEAAADAQALESQFSQVFGDMEDEAADRLEKIGDDTRILVNRMKGSYSQIAAFAKVSGVEQEEAMGLAERAMVAVADSAAYYDRSMEDVTNSLQSFLKGNFENDAALGLSCTETTRNAAANALYGKSFKDLSEAEKQFTLLQMVEDANKASGALGQAARESDTWTNQLGNLKQAFQDLKAAGGSIILQPVVSVLKILVAMTQQATKVVTNLTSENGLLTKSFDRFHALMKIMKPNIERLWESFSNGVSKAIEFGKGIINRFGGIENLLKILAIAAGAFVVAMNWSKITAAAGAFVKLMSGIGKMFSLANLKILAVVAVVVILALVIEDFVNFLMGNDSVIGSVFDKAGIGADNAREAIFNAWNKVVEFLTSVWDIIKTGAGMYVDTVTSFFERHGESIRKNFERAWGLIKTFLSGVWTVISQIASALFGSTEDEISGSTNSTKDKVLSTWQAILNALSAVWDAIYSVANAVFNALATVLEAVFGALKVFWDSWGSDIIAVFKVIFNSIGGILNGFIDVITGIANFIAAVFTGDWSGAWEAIKDIFVGIWEMVSNYITAVWEYLKLIFSMALAAIQAIWNVVWGAIKGFFVGIWNGIMSFISGIWDGIKGIFSNALSFVSGLIESVMNGISSVIEMVWNAISGFISGVMNSISSTVSAVWNGILTVISTIVNVISSVISAIWNGIQSVTQTVWNGIMSFISGIWNAITGAITSAINTAYSTVTSVFNSIKSTITSIVTGIKETVTTTFNNIVTGISTTIGKVKETIVTGFQAAINWIKGLPSQALTWGKDIIDGIVNGIKGAIGKVGDAVKGVADKIKSFLHFSVPDEGPLTDYESWMPDFMGGLAQGIEGSQDTLLDKVKDVAGGMATIMKGATANVGTAARSAVNNNNSTTITQNVDISNSYSGGSAETQKNVSKAMKKSANDATTYMARGLAFARG